MTVSREGAKPRSSVAVINMTQVNSCSAGLMLLLSIITHTERRLCQRRAIEKLRSLLDCEDLCPGCRLRKMAIEEAIRELEKPDG